MGRNRGGAPPWGANKFPEGRKTLRALQSSSNKFTNEYTCFYSLFKVRGLQTKENYLTWKKKGQDPLH